MHNNGKEMRVPINVYKDLRSKILKKKKKKKDLRTKMK